MINNWRHSFAQVCALVLVWSLVPSGVKANPSLLQTLPPRTAAEATQLLQQIEQQLQQGNEREAIPLAEKFVALLEAHAGEQHPEVADALNSLGILYFNQGNYTAALPLFQRALQIRETVLGADHPYVANSLNSLGSVHQNLGNYAAALPLFQRALQIREAALGANHGEVATSLNNLAILYYSQGNAAAALPLFERALHLQEQTLGATHPHLATSLNNLGELYRQQGNAAAALPLFQRALQIRETVLGATHPDVATSLNNLGFLYATQGNTVAALPLFQRALQIRETVLGNRHPETALSLNNLAGVYRQQGNASAALPLLQRALQIREQVLGDSHPDVALSLNNLGGLYWQQANLGQALAFFRRGLEVEEMNLNRNLVIGSEDYKRNYLATFQGTTDMAIAFHLQAAANNSEAADLALTTILRRKGRLLDFLGETQQQLRRQLQVGDRQRFEQLVNLRTQIANLSFAKRVAETAASRQQLQQQADELEALLSLRSADFRQATTPVTVAAVQQRIPPEAALVEFVRYRPYNPDTQRWQDPRYAVYVLQRLGAPQWQDLGSAAEIEALIRTARLHLADRRLSGDQIKAAAQALEARVMAPVRRLATGATHLLIAPDGQLNVIPFPALVDEQGRYLVESYTITLLTSGRDLLRLAQPVPRGQSPLVVADPTFDSFKPQEPPPPAVGQRAADLRTLGFDPLPGTAAEAEAIQRLLPQVKLLTQTQATEREVKGMASPHILHLATHGFFLPDRPATDPTEQGNAPPENPLLRSGLALAGFNQRQSGGEDGVLTALEVTGMDLRGTQLVVLSACDTGRGDVVNGEGVYGLRRAFTLAGARSQVSTLWKVDDQVTREIMVSFYRNLLQGMGRTEAMRQVQLEMLSTKLPYFWAAFISSGDWLPLPLSP